MDISVEGIECSISKMAKILRLGDPSKTRFPDDLRTMMKTENDAD
jgi:hypothetical protein